MLRGRWRRPRQAGGLSYLAVGCVALIAILNGRPEFSNASVPPRGIASPVVALEVARNVREVDSILGEAPSPDREAMRIKQYIDFAFIGCYVALYIAMAAFFRSPLGMIAGACGTIAGVLDVIENIAILRILDVPLRDTTQAMIDAIRYPSLAKWALAFVAIGLFGYLFVKREGFLSRATGAANLIAAGLGIVGLFDNTWLVWAGVPMLAGLAGIIARLFFPS
jgi:hypothetical protein